VSHPQLEEDWNQFHLLLHSARCCT